MLPPLPGLEDLYAQRGDDPSFGDVVARFDATSDADLADLIETDGRLRLRLGRPIVLDRYLEAVSDLTTRADALDAAIDMTLRALAHTGRADEPAVEALVGAHPALETQIRDAAALGNAIWSTTGLRVHLGVVVRRELPSEFGPRTSDGEPRYQLLELLGEGAFGQVYRAVDRQLSEPDHPAYVAIKVLAFRDDAGWRREQLIDEATKARRIDHPNVARVLDRGVSDENEDFIVYEFVEGGDLGRWARRRVEPLAVRDAASLVSCIARGVHAAHMAGLVHCDLKPNNVVIAADGSPKVVDFGIAIRADDRERDPRDADVREPLGNLAFMSPEQCRMEPGALNIPTDIYALGGILFWLVTNVLPNGATPTEIRRTHDPQNGRRSPPSMREHIARGLSDLDAICQRALAARPEDRYHSAAGLADDIEAWLNHEPVRWTRPSPGRRMALSVRRKPGLATTVGLLAVLAVASAVALERLAAAAADERFDKAIAETRLQEEERARRNSRQLLRKLIAAYEVEIKDGLGEFILVAVWVMEWLYGPTVLGDGPDKFQLWDFRLDVTRQHLENARRAGAADGVRTLLWETALGFWLLRDAKYEDAEQVIAENAARWRAAIRPDDPWLDDLEAMHACSRVGLLGLDTRDGRADVEEAGALAGVLGSAEARLGVASPGSPMHRLVLDHLTFVHGPRLLDRPDQLALYHEKITALAKP